MNGVFVCFEGTDGAGKSTIARQVADRLTTPRSRIVFLEKNSPTVESGYATYHLTRLREVLWHYEPTAPLSELGDQHWLSLIASWFFAVQNCTLKPLLESAHTVICDGWYYKYLARFLLKAEPVSTQSRTLFSFLEKPDYVILLDVEPRVAMSRKAALRPSESGALETDPTARIGGFIEYQSRVRQSLLTCCDCEHAVIDTTELSVGAVVERAASTLSAWLTERQSAPATSGVVRQGLARSGV